MRHFIVTIALCLGTLGLSSPALSQEASKPQQASKEIPSGPKVALVEFSTSESQKRLMRGSANVDFFRLANEFEAQMNIGTCGPTSAVIVLNALRPSSDERRPVDRSAFPEDRWKQLPPGFTPVKGRYTQRAFLDKKFMSVKPKARFYGAKDDAGQRDPGLRVRELQKVLALHGVEATLRIVTDELPAKTIKAELIANLKRPDDYVLINYHRKALGQPGGGHISPVAAYDAKTDSFLVMDVNPNKAPWVWVSSGDLIAAMRTFDKDENRGYVLVAEGTSKSSKTGKTGK